MRERVLAPRAHPHRSPLKTPTLQCKLITPATRPANCHTQQQRMDLPSLIHEAPWNSGMRIPHVEVVTPPRQNPPVQSHTTTVAPSAAWLKSMRAAAFQPHDRMLCSGFVPTSPCLMDPWIRPFAIGIAPVFHTHCFVRIRKISGATVSRSASRRAFERPLPKALRELPFQKINLQPFGRCRWFFFLDVSIPALRPRKRIAKNC